jgi:beta-glucanase (GH16 family)
MIERITALLCVLLLVSGSAGAQNRKLIWADEFNYSGLPDSTKWNYQTGNSGWGNHELEYYTSNRPENARVENGLLVIEARKEDYLGARYTSARLDSKSKGDWKYGRIEVKAKIPAGKGMWPAIWMLPTTSSYGGWPHSGEIDVMENVGYWPDSVFGSVHTGSFNHRIGTQKTKGIFHKDFANDFHVYAIDWTPEQIVFFLDGVPYHEFKNDHQGSEHWPFDQPFRLLLNVAVGGDWGGKQGVDDNIFPQKMLVDYVRVYQ